jgi:hypothetical protein
MTDDLGPRGEDFDDRMRQLLRQHAEDAPRVDLTDGSLRQARRIRLRRRVAVGAAVLAVAAVAIPVGIGLVDPAHDPNLADRTNTDDGTTGATGTPSGPPTTVIALGDLAGGDAPAVPYIAAGELVRDGDSTPVPGAPDDVSDPSSTAVVVDAAAFDDGVAGFILNTHEGSLTVPSGGESQLPSSPGTTQPAIDKDGSVAYAVKGRDATGAAADDTSTIVYATRLGDTPRFASTDQLVIDQVMDVEHGVALFNAVTPRGKQVVGSVDFGEGPPATLRTPYADVVSLSAADQGIGLMAGRTTTMRRHCNAMLTTANASELWRSCRWRPTEFSPDGSRVFAVGLPLNGAPVQEAAVIDANTGSVIHTFTTAGRFGRATFEPDNALDIVTVEDGDSAIVRCRSEGGCELATAPQPARPGSLVAPYQLTANP